MQRVAREFSYEADDSACVKAGGGPMCSYDVIMGRGQQGAAPPVASSRSTWPPHYDPRPIDRQATRDRIGSALRESEYSVSMLESGIRISESRARKLRAANERLSALVDERGIDGMIEDAREAISKAHGEQEELRAYDTEEPDLDGLQEIVTRAREIFDNTPGPAFKMRPIERALGDIEDIAWEMSDRGELAGWPPD